MTPTLSLSSFSWRRAAVRGARPAFWLAAIAVSAWLVSVSWAKWADPLIDFGVQLYIPWRITLGEHLGRDFVYPYGPLSSYFNATLFRVFGVSLRTLVVANLFIFAGIFACLHVLLRRAFGFLPAVFATLTGIAMLGFSQQTGVNNYTYAAPYSHEATHGLLLLLLLVIRLTSDWSRREPSGVVPGLLLGFIALTKVEIVFAAVIGLICFRLARGGVPDTSRANHRWTLALLAFAAAVLLASWGVLALFTDARSAAIAVGSGSVSPFLYPDFATSAQGRSFMGLDFPLDRAGFLISRGGVITAIIALISVTGVGLGYLAPRLQRIFFGLFGVAGLGALGWAARLPGQPIGDYYPFMLLAGVVVLAIRWLRERRQREIISARTFAQVLLLVTAVAMMSRMGLSPRIYHYGFVQALVATVWLMAFYVGEWPRVVAASRAGRGFVGATLGLLFACTAISLVVLSRNYYGMRSQPIGIGGDRIVGYAPDYTLGHRYVEDVRDYLVTHTSPSSTLLVMPEGIMVNYLARRKTPLRIINLLPASLHLNGRDVVAELAEHPPDRVLFISRMVVDDHLKPFGEDDEHGRGILKWVAEQYQIEVRIGRDPRLPFTPADVGWILLKRKSLLDLGP